MYTPGLYKVKTTDQGYTKSSQGTPEFFLTFLVLAQVGAGGKCQQFERTYYQALTDNTIGFFIKKLKAIGVEIDRLERLNPQALEGAVNLIGREITANCSHSEYEGKTREQWDLIPSGRKKLSVEEVRKLDDIFDLGTKKPAAPTPPRRNHSNETI